MGARTSAQSQRCFVLLTFPSRYVCPVLHPSTPSLYCYIPYLASFSSYSRHQSGCFERTRPYETRRVVFCLHF
jgi:hypothetical protein